MLNRRHIRVKILQILYSQNRSKSTNKELYNFFNSTTKKFYQFFITQLHFFVLIKQETIRRVEINKKKYYQSKIDFLGDFIVKNKFIKAIEDSKYIEQYITKNEINYFKNDIKIVGNPNLNLNGRYIIKNFRKDHRVFMMSCIAAFSFGGYWKIYNPESVNTSFPNFFKIQFFAN